MLNFIYWPISAVMWFWYEVLSNFMNPDSGWTWALSIVLLTVTVKALLLWPTIKQQQSMRAMSKLGPKMSALQERYKNDPTKLSAETQKLYKESKVNPLMGCLPMLIQIPVFIGLFHVLRSFNRTGTGAGGLGMTAEENRNTANYIFSPEHVQSFLDARIFGVPLSASISMGQDELAAFGVVDFERWRVFAVAVPMIVLVAVVTHVNARLSLRRQEARKAAGKVAAPTGDNAEMMQMQQDMMGKMMLWMMPAFTIFTGWIWTIGLLIYMSVNVMWSLFQMMYIFRQQDKEEEKEEAEKAELAKATAPVVGARPVNKHKKAVAKDTPATSAAQDFEQRVNSLPAIEPEDRDFVYLSNAERKALGQAKRQEYDLAREAFERRNPEIAEAAAAAGAAGFGRQWVVERVKERYNT